MRVCRQQFVYFIFFRFDSSLKCTPQNITSLDEGGLLLWQAALRNTITIDSVNGAPGLIEMFPLLVSLLEVNLDLLGKIIGLLESYFLLGAPLILQVNTQIISVNTGRL